jgi:hypothetical protein
MVGEGVGGGASGGQRQNFFGAKLILWVSERKAGATSLQQPAASYQPSRQKSSLTVMEKASACHSLGR